MAPTPRFQIPSQVFAFSFLMAPALIYAEYYRRNAPSDEDLREILQAKYGKQIETAQASRSDFQDFMEEMKNNSKELDKRMESVLYGGKNASKRVYAVDETLYGKSDGPALKKQSLAEMKTREEKIRLAKERRERRVAGGNDSANVPSSSLLSDPQAQSVVALLAVGTLAAAVGFFFGGSKRQ